LYLKKNSSRFLSHFNLSIKNINTLIHSMEKRNEQNLFLIYTLREKNKKINLTNILINLQCNKEQDREIKYNTT
jgi:hypothetical protein